MQKNRCDKLICCTNKNTIKPKTYKEYLKDYKQQEKPKKDLLKNQAKCTIEELHKYRKKNGLTFRKDDYFYEDL